MEVDKSTVKVAITGAKGRIGRAVSEYLNPGKFEVIPIDIPEIDASDLEALLEATKNADVIMHFAWKDLVENARNETIDPINTQMTFNIYEAAVRNNISRAIMASSNHAHAHDIRDRDGKIRPTTLPNNTPNNPYGAEKLFMEALGRYFSKEHGLEVICLRIGNLNDEDRPKSISEENPRRYISKRDMGRLALACLEAKKVPDNFQILYAVSQQSVFDWINPFGYKPLDGNI